LIEEGLLDDDITDRVIVRYLEPLLADGIDTLVLGCTHYPLLSAAIARVLGREITLVDSRKIARLQCRKRWIDNRCARRLQSVVSCTSPHRFCR